ncbi:hypothetical protein [Coleofasciculus sp. H7-2]|uniref:hypothetical protein n=1 Tax=Coleofasciculus sp. H7-2 TaxID=3351545 RepID=UPI00366D7D47
MSIAKYVPRGIRRPRSVVKSQRIEACCRWRVVAYAIALSIMLWGCRASDTQSPTWKTYKNPRYSFEFPYPSTWIAAPMPDNRDGRAFRDPQAPEVEILGVAGDRLPEIELAPSGQKNPHQFMQQNFTTQQGVTGKLYVELRSDISLMRLTLIQGRIRYYWQGRSPSKEFSNYYRFFYYVAGQYRIPLQSKSGEGERLTEGDSRQ